MQIENSLLQSPAWEIHSINVLIDRRLIALIEIKITPAFPVLNSPPKLAKIDAEARLMNTGIGAHNG